MQHRIELTQPTHSEWIKVVLQNFPSFLQDHANCERKASAMAMSFVAKYPDRVKILDLLIDTAIEEMVHFKQVYAIMQKQNIPLSHEIDEDPYVNNLLKLCRTGREERFMDRLLLASIIETRGAERFKIVYENLPKGELKDFYHTLWASEARHGEIFIDMALKYFDKQVVYKRTTELNRLEGEIVEKLPHRAAMH
ncbi:MAG: tRNA-(ms[2]io[6]A)-hydroxylase [Cytophagales bacterium]|nr:tRNA-(ms[2]io[6]A)-hydroxylase [Cytophagales bacterium]